MRNVGRLALTFIVTIVIGGIAVGACLAALVPGTVEIATSHHYTVDEPDELRELSERTTVYWADGSVMDTLGLRDRELVKNLDEVPLRIQNAIIATEDRTFWTNDGIDLGAVFRAFVTNVVSGEIQQGGSTITQQLAKNRLFNPKKRNVTEKVREIQAALRLNEKFSKEKILLEYMNTVNFGLGSYGIKAAARRFFVIADPAGPFPLRGKNMDELTIGEAALLAGVIKNPEGNSPFFNPDIATRQRAAALRAQVEEGYITQAEADAANLEPLPFIQPPLEQRPDNYLVAEVQESLLNDPALGNTREEREAKLLKGGLQVYTTFDPRLQAIAQDATDNAKPPREDPNFVSSLVSIEYETGAVRAMIGGPDFSNEYNIATHVPGRQPGSTWKVITLTTALANGYTANDTVDGSSPCNVPSKFPLTPPDQFPTNSEGNGNRGTTIRSATAGSVNCSFIRLSTSVGLDKVIEMGNRMGLTQPLQPLLNLSIGTVEATPLEMATVMSTIANNGVKNQPHVVARVVDAQGVALIDRTSPTGERIFSDEVAACTKSLLRGAVTGGTGGNAQIPGYSVFGKTGTTDIQADAWFIGSAGNLATSVWFGNRTNNDAGAGFGGQSSAPIFRAFMAEAVAGQPDRALPPEGPLCTGAGQNVNEAGGRGGLPDLSGLVVAEQPTVQQLPTARQQQPTVTPVNPTVPTTTTLFAPGTLPR